jgi:CubicO group peptidase (beta-lactamase class C family)
MVRPAALVVVLAAACGATAHPAAPVPLTADELALAARLDATIQRAFADRPMAGLSIAVLRHGHMLLARGYGQADLETHTPAAADTIYRYASITKSFTAAAILALARQGKLTIDDPVSRYVPDADMHGKPITIRNLLNHTSGLKDYTELDGFTAHMAEPMTRAALVDLVDAHPLNFEPGSRWAYSNTGYYLLGLVIEKVTGEAYADAVARLVIAPAGLPDTRYCARTMTGPRDAHAYRIVDDKLAPAAPIDMAHPYAAGALCGTAPDLVHWLTALAGRRGEDASAWTQMTTPVTLTDGAHFDYGMGLQLGVLGGHRRVGHNGGINGYGAQMDYYPDDDLAIAAIDNNESGAASRIAEDVARVALGIPEAQVLDLPISAADGAALVGRYDFPEVGVQLDVRLRDGLLEAASVGGDEAARSWLRLQAQGDHVFVVPKAGLRLTFVIAGAEAASVEVEQGGATVHGQRVAP